MKIPPHPPWDVSPDEAVAIQRLLREKVSLSDGFHDIKLIAGADTSFSLDGEIANAVVVVLTFPDLVTIERRYAAKPVTFPYVPGLLSFREGPALLEAFSLLENEPDLIFFDGHGIAHPRRLGIASHIGVILDKPSIGCAKSRLFGHYAEPANEVGAYTPLLAEGNELIGYAVRTRRQVRPIFISPGHKISFESALRISMECAGGYRLPEPVRRAHNFSQAVKQPEEIKVE
jgi:deoxyribonuclease V